MPNHQDNYFKLLIFLSATLIELDLSQKWLEEASCDISLSALWRLFTWIERLNLAFK